MKYYKNNDYYNTRYSILITASRTHNILLHTCAYIHRYIQTCLSYLIMYLAARTLQSEDKEAEIVKESA